MASAGVGMGLDFMLKVLKSASRPSIFDGKEPGPGDPVGATGMKAEDESAAETLPPDECDAAREELRHIASALQSIDDKVQRRALARELARLSSQLGAPMLAHVMSDDLMVQTMHMIEADDLHCTVYASVVLANLAYVQTGQARILRVDGTRLLMDLIKRCADVGRPASATDQTGNDGKSGKIGHVQHQALAQALAALQNLTYNNTEACNVLYKRGSHILLKRLLEHHFQEVREYVAGTLANIHFYATKAIPLGPSDPRKKRPIKVCCCDLRRVVDVPSSHVARAATAAG